MVENLQILAARAARQVWNGSPDLFGEEEAIENLRTFSQTRNVSEATIRRQVENLTLAANSLAIPMDILAKLRSDEELRPWPPAGV